MNKIKVLFVCVHNSARSQMAEAFLNTMAPHQFLAESAGLDPGTINPYVVKVMKELGIDLSGKKTNSVYEFFKEERTYDVVITVCDESSGEKCPIFPGKIVRQHWLFEDPSSFKGSNEQIIEKTRKIRDQIKVKVETFLKKKSNYNVK
jgi:arsenate reductase